MKRIVFVILIASLLLAGCSFQKESFQEWEDVVYKEENLEDLPEEYTETLSAKIAEWVSENCSGEKLPSWSLGFETEGIEGCKDVPQNEEVLESSIASFATLIAAQAIPGWADDVVAVRYVISANGVKTVFSVFVVAASATGIYLAHTSKDHSPNVEGTKARENISLLLNFWSTAAAGGGPPPQDKLRCAQMVLVEGEKRIVIRYAIWLADAATPEGGFVAWYHTMSQYAQTPWGGSYGIPLGDFESGPSEAVRKKHGWEWELIDCLIGGGLPPLQGAQ